MVFLEEFFKKVRLRNYQQMMKKLEKFPSDKELPYHTQPFLYFWFDKIKFRCLQTVENLFCSI